jgi:hypothetical protein
MPEHDVLSFASGLSAKLASRSRHVCLFLGAGAARACGLPDVAQLQERVLALLTAEARELFTAQLQGRNLEQALSRLRRIAALLTGEQTIDGISAAEATSLDNGVCQAIVRELDIKNADLSPVYRLAAWIARADYLLPVELFTVNYDLLLETALDRLRVPYFDGFVGTLQARFHTELVEGAPGDDKAWLPALFVRLWKLHGSVNWAWEGDQQIVRLGQPVSEGLAAAIYPSDTKYEESRRVPFVVLQDRLRRAVQQPETLVIVAGYSFSDAHLNELLFDAAARRQRNEFIAFSYSDIPEVLASRASTTPNLQVVSGTEGILGGIRGPWKSPEDPPPNLWVDDKFALRDFGELTKYLARSLAKELESEAILRQLLLPLAAQRDSGVEAENNA